ncbi:MAG: V-type ATP synthase subunit I [Bacillota bacterium]
MAVAKMKKVTLFASQDLKERIFEALRDLGTMQVTAESVAPQRTEDFVETRDFSARLSKLTYLKAYFEKYNRIKKSFIDMFTGKKPEVTMAEIEDATASYDIDGVSAVVKDHEDRLKRIADEFGAIASEKEALRPWSALDVPLESLGNWRFAESLLSIVPLAALDQLDSGLCGISAHYEKVWEARSEAGLWMAGLRDSATPLSAVVSSVGGSIVAVKASRPGTVSEVLQSLESRVAELESQKALILQEDIEMSASLTSVMGLMDYYLDKKNLDEVEERVGRTRFTHVIEGYVKARDVDSLRQAFAGTPLVEVVDEDPAEGDDVPVYLENHPLIRPFEVITNIYGFPKYTEIDPTPFLAPFFWIFFGICLGDAVYGIVLWLGCRYFLKTQKLADGGQKLVKLLMYCGISTIIVGALTASWMADLATAFLPGSALESAINSLAILNPVADPLTMLVISFGFGILQVWVGIGVKMLGFFRHGQYAEGILSCGSWMLFLPGLIAWALTKTGLIESNIPFYVMLAGALMVMYSTSRGQKNILLKPFSGLYGLYGTIGYFSDTMSYSRLLALGLASAIIGMVVNKIAFLMGSIIPVVGWVFVPVILIGGHVFNLVINVLGSFIHAGRLQFVEFFTKFFEGGGRPFKPLTRVNDNVSLTD